MSVLTEKCRGSTSNYDTSASLHTLPNSLMTLSFDITQQHKHAQQQYQPLTGTLQHTARTYQTPQSLNVRSTYPVRLLARSRANLARRRRQQITSKASRGKPRMQETIGITTDSGETATNTGAAHQGLRLALAHGQCAVVCWERCGAVPASMYNGLHLRISRRSAAGGKAAVTVTPASRSLPSLQWPGVCIKI